MGDGGTLAIVAYLGMFAVITPALISGAVADRMKFSAWALFVPLWLFLVYVPIFKWVFGGWLGQRGSLDFAGGTAIHVNAGIASLAAVLVLGKRRGWPQENEPPHSMPLVMIGAGILWFGWFGFNAGSALAANGQAAQAFMNTFLAAAAAGLIWILVEWLRDGHADQPRRSLRHRGRARGDHTGCRLRVGRRAARHRRPGRRDRCYAVRLKTRAGYDDAPRRRRRALLRWAHRITADRVLRQPGLLHSPTARRSSPEKACSTVAG